MTVPQDPSPEHQESFKAALASRAKSLQLLYDYTKFHIGVYITLTASYITLATVKLSDPKGGRVEFLHVDHCWMGLAVVCFLMAGLAGGVIVSSITQFTGGGSAEFLETTIGPWNGKQIYLRARYWTYIEHTAFWIGLIAAIASVALPGICA